MKCHEFERLWAHASPLGRRTGADDLSPAARAHLVDCPACAALVRADVATDAALRRIAAQQPQPGADRARQSLRAALAGAPPPRRSLLDRFLPVRPAFGLAAAGLAAAILFAAALPRPGAAPEKATGRVVLGNPPSPPRPSSSNPGREGRTAIGSVSPLPAGYPRAKRVGGGEGSGVRAETASGEIARAPRHEAPAITAAASRSPLGSAIPSVAGPARPLGDLEYLNQNPAEAIRLWSPLRADEIAALERKLRQELKRGDDFVYVPLPRISDAEGGQIARAVESYKREATIVDPRLFRKVTLQFKAAPLSEICDRLRADTGIQLAAGQSVADEKLTLFCKETLLRDVMRQMSRPFGYTWLRSGSSSSPESAAPAKGYRYELVQDLRSQLAEEELRSRDRHNALVALDREVARYRRYLLLSPDEARARAKSAPPAEKKLLEALGGYGWGPVQLYFRLTPEDLAALRAGQSLIFSVNPRPGERRLPPGVAKGVLRTMRDWRLFKRDDAFHVNAAVHAPEDARPPAAVPEARPRVRLSLRQSELGQFVLDGTSGFHASTKDDGPPQIIMNLPSGPLAVGGSPDEREGGKSVTNGATEAALNRRVTFRPRASCHAAVTGARVAGSGSPQEHKVSSADVLEALHRATDLPIVADAFTRLYPPAEVSPQNRPLAAAVRQLAERMRMKWNRDDAGAWLQFRSATFFDDRQKEVPSRLLARWAASRRQQQALPLEDLIEIAGLADAQLDAEAMAEGARDCWGIAEWDLARRPNSRRHLRYLAEFTPEQRRQAQSPEGLPFVRMTLAQQQRFMAFVLPGDAEGLQSLEELAGAALRVEYTQPGSWEWRPAGLPWFQWVVPAGTGRRALRPPARAGTREEALAAARKDVDRYRPGMLQAVRRVNPTFEEVALDPREGQVVPTELDLQFIYMPSASHLRPIVVARPGGNTTWATWETSVTRKE